MEVAVIGMGRMGNGVASRLLHAGHAVTVYNRTPQKAEALKDEGARVAYSLEEVATALPTPRIIWLYLPSGEVTREHIEKLATLLSPGDVVIDGGNSRFTATVAHAELLEKQGVSLVDAGTSGGIAGKEHGYCLMIGGDTALVDRLTPLWEAVAQPNGFRRVGRVGAGHYVKMVHNAIEYGMMQSYGEGMHLLAASPYQDELNLGEITQLWQQGSIIRSYLGGLLAEALTENSTLEGIGSRIDDNGEGRWSLEEALERQVPMPAIYAALQARYASRNPESFSNRIVAILRNKFGGHAIVKNKEAQ